MHNHFSAHSKRLSKLSTPQFTNLKFAEHCLGTDGSKLDYSSLCRRQILHKGKRVIRMPMRKLIAAGIPGASRHGIQP